MAEADIKIYSGFFASFTEARPHEQGFAGDRWLQSLEDFLAAVRNSPADSKSVDPLLLANVQDLLSKTGTDIIRILDVGGGLGASSFWLEKVMGDAFARLQIMVMDIPAVTAHAEKLGLDQHWSNLDYTDGFPAQDYDLVNFGSSLHYFESVQDALQQAAGTGAKRILMSRTPICEAGSYVTLQNYYESRIPVNIIGLADIKGWCEALGYGLEQLSASASPVLGNRSSIPTEDIPDVYRFDFYSDLVFVKP